MEQGEIGIRDLSTKGNKVGLISQEEIVGIQFYRCGEKLYMKAGGTLDKINSEDHVNEIISRDEEASVKGDSSAALQIAEDLIRQLPPSHEGRNEWLRKYGSSEEAVKLQQKS